jgi:hypothetical protein
MITQEANELTPRRLAARRVAETLLQALGGTSVVVRVPMGAGSGEASQFGLATVPAEDVTIHPVVVRSVEPKGDARIRIELIFSAASLSRAKEIHSVADALEFFYSAIAILHQENLFKVEAVLADEFGGTPYLYRVMVAR